MRAGPQARPSARLGLLATVPGPEQGHPSPAEKRVCVTGASGFVGSQIVRELLEHGYRVRGTVRSTAKATEQGHLTSLPGAERLELIEADLNQPGSFDEAVRGSDYVIHTASPYVVTVDDPQRDLVDPAVNGTRSVLNSVRKAGDVHRFVVTSSMAGSHRRAIGHLQREGLERDIVSKAQPLLLLQGDGRTGRMGIRSHQPWV